MSSRKSDKSNRSISRIRNGTDNYYNIPSTLKHNYSGFGFGKKEPSYIHTNDCPSPNHYKITRLFEKSKSNARGIAPNSGRELSFCSFGIPFSFYEKVTVGPLENKSQSNIKTMS